MNSWKNEWHSIKKVLILFWCSFFIFVSVHHEYGCKKTTNSATTKSNASVSLAAALILPKNLPPTPRFSVRPHPEIAGTLRRFPSTFVKFRDREFNRSGQRSDSSAFPAEVFRSVENADPTASVATCTCYCSLIVIDDGDCVVFYGGCFGLSSLR